MSGSERVGGRQGFRLGDFSALNNQDADQGFGQQGLGRRVRNSSVGGAVSSFLRDGASGVRQWRQQRQQAQRFAHQPIPVAQVAQPGSDPDSGRVPAIFRLTDSFVQGNALRCIFDEIGREANAAMASGGQIHNVRMQQLLALADHAPEIYFFNDPAIPTAFGRAIDAIPLAQSGPLMTKLATQVEACANHRKMLEQRLATLKSLPDAAGPRKAEVIALETLVREKADVHAYLFAGFAGKAKQIAAAGDPAAVVPALQILAKSTKALPDKITLYSAGEPPKEGGKAAGWADIWTIANGLPAELAQPVRAELMRVYPTDLDPKVRAEAARFTGIRSPADIARAVETIRREFHSTADTEALERMVDALTPYSPDQRGPALRALIPAMNKELSSTAAAKVAEMVQALSPHISAPYLGLMAAQVPLTLQNVANLQSDIFGLQRLPPGPEQHHQIAELTNKANVQAEAARHIHWGLMERLSQILTERNRLSGRDPVIAEAQETHAVARQAGIPENQIPAARWNDAELAHVTGQLARLTMILPHGEEKAWHKAADLAELVPEHQRGPVIADLIDAIRFPGDAEAMKGAFERAAQIARPFVSNLANDPRQRIDVLAAMARIAQYSSNTQANYRLLNRLMMSARGLQNPGLKARALTSAASLLHKVPTDQIGRVGTEILAAQSNLGTGRLEILRSLAPVLWRVFDYRLPSQINAIAHEAVGDLTQQEKSAFMDAWNEAGLALNGQDKRKFDDYHRALENIPALNPNASAPSPSPEPAARAARALPAYWDRSQWNIDAELGKKIRAARALGQIRNPVQQSRDFEQRRADERAAQQQRQQEERQGNAGGAGAMPPMSMSNAAMTFGSMNANMMVNMLSFDSGGGMNMFASNSDGNT